MSPSVEVDARGRRCPLPVIDLARAARDAAPGTVIDLIADDPAAESDVRAWCGMRGHELVSVEPLTDDATLYRIHLAPTPSARRAPSAQ